MNPKDLKAIRNRHKIASEYDVMLHDKALEGWKRADASQELGDLAYDFFVEDTHLLLAEIDRLRAENERLDRRIHAALVNITDVFPVLNHSFEELGLLIHQVNRILLGVGENTEQEQK